MILKNARLIGALSGGFSSESTQILLQDGKITRIFEGEVPKDSAQEIYDCRGMTLLPGLFDIHTHVTGLVDFDHTDKKALDAQAERYLEYGFTTIRDCGSMDRCVNDLRDRIDRGLACGPNILSCGKIVTPTETSSKDSLLPMYSEADGPYEMRKAARREIAEGADFIKTMASGSAFHRQGIPNQPIIMEDELSALVQAANKKNTYVAAHAHADSSIALCIKSGVRTIEHATYIKEETIRLLMDTPECFLVPTLAAMHVSVPDEEGFWSRRLGEMLKICCENISTTYEVGAKLGFGTDSAPGMEQYEQGMEFRFRKELCGMENTDILLQATRYSAEIVGLADTTGTIKEGYTADLILVDGKPDQDISVMYHKPVRVIKGGRFIAGYQTWT